jgi:hypothetical protein
MDDFLLFDTILTPEERLIRDSVRSFVDEQIIPIIPEAF